MTRTQGYHRMKILKGCAVKKRKFTEKIATRTFVGGELLWLVQLDKQLLVSSGFVQWWKRVGNNDEQPHNRSRGLLCSRLAAATSDHPFFTMLCQESNQTRLSQFWFASSNTRSALQRKPRHQTTTLQHLIEASEFGGFSYKRGRRAVRRCLLTLASSFLAASGLTSQSTSFRSVSASVSRLTKSDGRQLKTLRWKRKCFRL